jgi:hypothetical protein
VEFKARIILLGASNATKGVSTILETAQALIGSPLDVYAAIGHGRSYGLRTRVLGRGLPSVLDSRLWQVVGAGGSRSAVPTYAVISDIGNDVMYGSSPETTAAWLEECFERLRAIDANVVCTSLPMARLKRLSEWQYLLARTIIFPTRRLTFEQAMGRAHELDERVRRITQARGIPFFELPREWYGVDPIHIRPRFWAQAWGEILDSWLRDGPSELVPYRAKGSLSRWLKLRSCSPETWWLWGMRRGRVQPCATLADGTRVSMY